MIGFAAERLMEMEVAGLTGAAYGEKSSERLAHSGALTAPQPQPAFLLRVVTGRCCRLDTMAYERSVPEFLDGPDEPTGTAPPSPGPA